MDYQYVYKQYKKITLQEPKRSAYSVISGVKSVKCLIKDNECIGYYLILRKHQRPIYFYKYANINWQRDLDKISDFTKSNVLFKFLIYPISTLSFEELPYLFAIRIKICNKSQIEYNELHSKHTKLQNKYNKLQIEHAKLQNKYDKVNRKHRMLQTRMDTVNEGK